MKRFYLLTLLISVATALSLSACNNDEPTPTIPERKPSTVEKMSYEFISEGLWTLTHWDGRPLDESLFCYIDMNEDGSYEMWDNLGSMYAHHSTGHYTLSKEDNHDYLRGTYDHGVGNWNDSYEVIIYGYEFLDWVSLSTGEVMNFERIFELPEIE